MSVRAKAFTGNGSNLALLDHTGAEFCGADAVFGNVREHIECALGFGEGKSHFRQPPADIFPALPVNFPHGGGVGLQCCNGSLLQEGGYGRNGGGA